MKEKIYLSGTITGDAGYRENFEAGVRHFVDLGWSRKDIVNPVEYCPEGWSWRRCMWRCVRLLLRCGYVGMLPNWRDSRGARIEHQIAQLTGKWIVYVGGRKQKGGA